MMYASMSGGRTKAFFLTTAATLLLGHIPAPASASEADPTTLLLTWQQDPTTTMTVQWLQQAEKLPLAGGQHETTHAHAVPRREGAAAPRAAEPWPGPALEVPLLLNDEHRVPDPDEFGADLKLGWTEEGLLARVAVRDLTPDEYPEQDQMWRADSIELFTSTGVGEPQRYQVVLGPGTDPEQDQPRKYFYDHRPDADTELTMPFDVSVHEEGYVAEVLLPWASLGITSPGEGTELAFQVLVNNSADGESRGWVGWQETRDASRDPQATMPIRLVEDAPAPANLRATLASDDPEELVVDVVAVGELAGEAVTVHAGDQQLVESTLAEGDDGLARAELFIPAAPEGERWGELDVRTAGETRASVSPPALYDTELAEESELAYRHEDEETFQHARTEVHRMHAWPGMFRQRVELTGLEPASTYVFEVPGVDRTFQFRTMPEDANEPIRFATGGDTRHNQAWMEQTSQQAMKYDIDFVVWGGDLAYADGLESNLYRWEEWFEANYNTLIDEDGRVLPIVAGIGNHEVQGGYMVNRDDYEASDEYRARYAPYFFQLFAFPGQPGYDVLDFGDYLSLVMLDTNHANPVSGEQTQWLETVLAEREHVPHVLPVYHVPGYPSHRPYDGSVSQLVRDYWLPLFEAYGVEMAFENHDHTYKRTHPIREGNIDPHRGIVYLGDGAWGVGVREVHDVDETWYLRRAESMRHAMIVTLHGRHRHVLVVDEDGQIIDEYPQVPKVED